MDWKLSRRMWMLLGLAVVLVVVLVMLSGRPPVPKVAVVHAVRENLTASIFSNGKVEPITPYALRAQLATFVEKILAVEGQAVKSGQLLMTLNASGARADLARTREELVSAQEDLRAARAGGRADEVAQLESDLRHFVGRSEEHTSELQSRLHLVCRLLLEKKKT